MNSFKLFVFILLLFGSLAQRFQRHLINGTQNGLINGNTEMNNLDVLSSDGENAIKFVRNGEEAELELENKELMFKFCSVGCMGKKVVACFDSTDSNSLRQGDCDPGQCEFKAGVAETDETFLWFKTDFYRKLFSKDSNICETAIMKWPDAIVSFSPEFPSCNPLKHDGNVIKLYILQAKRECPLYVLNAKKWTPPSPTTTTQNSSNLSETKETTSKFSEANTALWIGIGVGIFILLIVVIGFGYCCYRKQLQKNPLFGKKKNVQQTADIPEASKKANFVKEKTADEEQVLKAEPTKVATKEESTVTKEKQPAKKKFAKEKKAPIVEAKPSKEVTQENGTKEDAKKVSIEPTLQDVTTDDSVVQKSVVKQKQPGNRPRVFVPKKVILPAMNSDGFKSVSLLDTLSGAENDETHASEKSRKNEFAGRKKGSKKHR